MSKQFIVLRRWTSSELMDVVNKHLKQNWELYGDTFTHMEFRNHAITGDEYLAPMFCQSITKELPK